MQRIFISDLHLDEARPDLTEAFGRFLADKTENADELYILGDFFEVWLGDDHDTGFNASIVDLLNRVSCRKFIMHGNRDFLLGEDFCNATGAELIADPTKISLGGTRALLMHGDSLCTRDLAYMKARALFRDPAFQADFLAKSLEERAAFARQVRGESEALTRQTADDIMDVTPSEVIQSLENADATILIHGHTHRPAVHDITLGSGAGKRFVLGDWETETHYLEANDDQLNLLRYEF